MRPQPQQQDNEEELPPSKTKIKKQMHELQDLGEIIANLPKEKLRQLDLPENIFEACLEYKRISKFGALKRQMLYIGRLMRDIDTAPILAKMDTWNGNSRQHTAWLHLVERWRDRLMEEDEALTEFMAAYPAADSQQLRALIRNAKKEKELMKPLKSYREIFQLLRELIPQP
ncbi:MAG: ribosome biogenesis factor YjgA [Sideroxydans sp.]|nr:ribosome biogenesis factor YjgA [Sideroxydans sp.]